MLTIHYSKNIALKDGSTPYHFINKIKEANISLSLDVNQTDYRNEGHSYKWHCNSYEVVFYDKIKDLEKARQSDKRTLEKDNTIQLDIFDQLAARKKKLEILRMEVRLNKRQKMKQLFTKLGIKLDFTFKGVFKPVISRKVLLHYFDELESKRPPLYDYQATSDKSMLASLILNNPEMGPKQVLQLFGFKKALETINPRELRTIFATYNERSWFRLMSDVSKVKLPKLRTAFSTIRQQLVLIKPLKIFV